MASFRTGLSRSRAAPGATIIAMELCGAGAALASQGPGGGMGSAGHLTQMAMAVLVYGASAIIVGAGLLGALRGRSGSSR